MISGAAQVTFGGDVALVRLSVVLRRWRGQLRTASVKADEEMEQRDVMAEIVSIGRAVAGEFLQLAAILLLIGIGIGFILPLYYTPLGPHLNGLGWRLYLLRPLHTGATIGWIYLAGVAMAYRWLFEHLSLHRTDRDALAVARRVAWRARVQLWLWIMSALIAATAYATGHTTGREYLEYPPYLALPILAAWLLFAVNFAVVTGLLLAGFLSTPGCGAPASSCSCSPS